MVESRDEVYTKAPYVGGRVYCRACQQKGRETIFDTRTTGACPVCGWDFWTFATLISYQLVPYRGPDGTETKLPRILRDALVRQHTTTNLRALRAVHRGDLVTLEGEVIRVDAPWSYRYETTYACWRCGNRVHQREAGVRREGQVVPMRPGPCLNPACGSTGPFDLQPDESKYIDFQLIELRERRENVPDGLEPLTILGHLYGDRVNAVRLGDQVHVEAYAELGGWERDDIHVLLSKSYLNISSVKLLLRGGGQPVGGGDVAESS